LSKAADEGDGKPWRAPLAGNSGDKNPIAGEQVLTAVTAQGELTLPKPFAARYDSDDQYQLMVESIGDSVTGDGKVAIPPDDSVTNMRVLDRIREAAGI